MKWHAEATFAVRRISRGQASIPTMWRGLNAFELIVATWLGDVMWSAVSTEGDGDDRDWLARSGFRTAVEGGRIEYEAAA